MSLQMTASQTVGPFLHIGLHPNPQMVTAATQGERILVEGWVFDGNGAPVGDAMLEIWQANSHGKYAHPDDTSDLSLDPAFSGFGRVNTEADGGFRFTTVKPGRVPGAGGSLQAPHLMVSIFSRGLLKHLVTRMYFSDEVSNAEDPVLNQVPAERRASLIAKSEAGTVRWNIVLQGADETVFFDI